MVERNRLLYKIYRSTRTTQNEILKLLNGAAIAAHDVPLTEGAVHKVVSRQRALETADR